MKYIKKTLLGLGIVLALSLLGLYVFGYGYIFKAVWIIYGSGHSTAFLSDYEFFDNRTVKKGYPNSPWNIHKDYNKVEPTETLQALHKKYESVAFLIVKNDSLWHEHYFGNYSDNSLSNSFSMAKTYVSALLGKAIGEGFVKNLNQPVKDFLPEFSEGLAAKLTVGDLASMASGSDWDESYYSPFSITTRAYFDENTKDLVKKIKIVSDPGKEYVYQSGNTLLLGMVIEKAVGKPLSEYLSESLWKPLGAENDALWQLDSAESGMEKAYCCLASNARDFARLGKLYKDYGKWNGKQILDSAFVAKSIRPRFSKSPEYGYGLWLLQHAGKSFFMMRGHLGQYVIVQPDDNIMIVRLGHLNEEEQAGNPFSDDIYGYINETFKMLKNAQ